MASHRGGCPQRQSVAYPKLRPRLRLPSRLSGLLASTIGLHAILQLVEPGSQIGNLLGAPLRGSLFAGPSGRLALGLLPWVSQGREARGSRRRGRSLALSRSGAGGSSVWLCPASFGPRDLLLDKAQGRAHVVVPARAHAARGVPVPAVVWGRALERWEHRWAQRRRTQAAPRAPLGSAERVRASRENGPR